MDYEIKTLDPLMKNVIGNTTAKDYIKQLLTHVEIPTLSEKIVASIYLIMFFGKRLEIILLQPYDCRVLI